MSHGPLLLILLVAAAYLAQLASPLRLNNDAEAYLFLAHSVCQGQGFTIDGEPTHFPPGYPATVALLDRIGLAHAPGLIALNLLALALGLHAWARLHRRAFDATPTTTAITLAATLLSWPMIKHATLPVSESLYTGLSLFTLALLHDVQSRTGRSRWLLLGVGLVLSVLAISVRTIGITLLPALLVAACPPDAWTNFRRRAGLALPVAGALLLIGAAVFAARTQYAAEMLEQFRVTAVAAHLHDKLLDFGELFFNLPSAKLPRILWPLVIAAGALVPIVVTIGFFRRRRFTPVDAYLLAYVGILLIWPYHDARFWVPILPLLAAYSLAALRPATMRPAPRWLAAAYASWFLALGAVALAHSTRISYAGPTFPDRYAGGALRSTYRAADGHPLTAAESATLNPRMLSLLRHYNPRAQSPPAK